METNMKKALATAFGVGVLSIAISSISIAQQPKTVELSIDNEQLNLETSAKTIEQLLSDIGYEYQVGSKISHKLDSKIEADMNIEIDTEKTIAFSKGGRQLNVTTFASTVGELLEQENVTLTKDDIVNPSVDTLINDSDEVKVDFYTFENYSKDEKIEFKKENKYSFDVAYGKEEIQQEGKDGTKVLNFMKTVKNGNEISNEKVSEEVKVEPVTEITLVGTRKVVKEKIENKTINRTNKSMYKGQSKVIQKGNDGILEKVYEVIGEDSKLVSEKVTKKATNRIVEKGTKSRPSVAKTSSKKSGSSPRLYSLRDLQFHGIIRWGGYKYTYYSQRVLPGGGLRIPGRHVNSAGYVSDGSGYIVLANDRPKGTVLPTPFGYMGKVYDRGTYGNHIDVYTR